MSTEMGAAGEVGAPQALLLQMAGEIPGIVWSTDGELRFTSCWGAGLADLSLRPNQAVGMTLFEYFGADNPEFPAIAAHRRALEGETVAWEQDWQGKIYQTRVAPLRDHEGRIVGCTGIAQDITHLNRTQEALREKEERCRSLVEQSLLGVVVVQNFRIVFANTVFAQICGYTVEELLALTPDQVRATVHPEDQALVWGRSQARSDGREVPSRYEYRVVGKDGTVRWLEIFAQVVLSHGKPAIQAAVVDISERKRMEEALRQSEEWARALLNAPADAMFLIDVSGRVVEANETWARALNRPVPELIGTCVFDQFPPPLAQLRREKVAEVARTGKPAHFEDEYEERVIESTVYPIFDRARKVIQVAVSARDVTERKRTEEALRQSEARARALLNVPLDAMYLLDADGTIVDANEAGAQRLNCSIHQLVGTCVFDRFPSDVAQRRREKAEEVARTGRPLRFEDERDGRFFDSTAYPVLDREGKVVQIAVSARDITDRVRAENTLRESQKRYYAIFEQAADSIVLIDPDTGRLVESNDRAHQSLGYTREEFERLTIADFEVVECAEEVASHLDKVVRGGSDSFETKHRTKAGEIRDIQVRATAISVGGRNFIQGIWRDITDRVRAEEALKRTHDELEERVQARTAALQEANRQLRQEIGERERTERELRESEKRRVEAEKLAATGRLAARVAHEINNPLAGIANCFRLVKAAVPPDHRHHKFTEIIEKEIDRIGRIVRQMFQVHRPDQETVRDVRVAETIGEVVAILEPNCRERRVRVETHADPAEMTIKIPEGSLRQILYNLLANAIEASPPDGVVRVAASAAEADDTVRITVADQGGGIPQAVQDRIFEPFFTTKESDTSGGLGLGLSISKGIVDSLRGSLDFQTEPGGGTTFRVILPAATN